MRKAIFLDRDGTLNLDENGYTYKIEDFKLHDGVIEGLKSLKEDYLLFIVSNQSGIGRGSYSEEDTKQFNLHMVNHLAKEGISIQEVLFCPHSPEANCDCRKPKTSLIKPLVKKYDLDLKNSWVIGDHPYDVQLAKNLGCQSVYLLTGHGAKHLDESRKILPDYIAVTFLQAAGFISSEESNKIISRTNLREFSNSLKDQGKSIVTINGSFDLLHPGHEKILRVAKAQGDLLIVGVNSDSSVKKYKGPERPINSENARAKMLARFDFVDHVTIFEETDPREMLELIRPNVHVNGAEYGENCIEAEVVKKHGGRIHLLERFGGYSTTEILNKK